MRLITTPKILRLFYPSFLWEMPKGEKKLYLTFDDGPHPTITPQVLEILKKFNAQATFFCIGNNVNKYKDTFELIRSEVMPSEIILSITKEDGRQKPKII